MKKFKKAKDIKVAVIGYGKYMGPEHIKLIQEAGMEPVVVVDPDRARLKAAKEDFSKLETYPSLTAMLKRAKVDLAIIVTPHNTHAALAIQCLNAGINVITEKPMAITTNECNDMIATAKKNKKMLSTFHNRHWDGCILQAVKILKKKNCPIGDIYRIQARWGGWYKPGNYWRTSKTISGGILYDWGVHLLEYSLQLINSNIDEVAGYARQGFWSPQTEYKNDTIEDEGYCVVRFKNGSWLSLRVTHLDANPPPYMLEITGTKGVYLMNHDRWKMILPKKHGKSVIHEGYNPEGEIERYYKNIVDHLIKGTKLIISPEWARRPIHILDLANRSYQEGKAIKAFIK